jgi:hypothetical protein
MRTYSATPGSYGATDARESQGNRGRDLGWEPSSAVGVVAEEQHERATGKLGELGSRGAELIAAQGDDDEIERVVVSLVDHRDRRVRRHVSEHVAHTQTLTRDFISPRAVR